MFLFEMYYFKHLLWRILQLFAKHFILKDNFDIYSFCTNYLHTQTIKVNDPLLLEYILYVCMSNPSLV